MANPEYAYGAFSKSAMVPLKVERKLRAKVKDTALEDAYARVNARDGDRCRVSDQPLSATHPSDEHRREHHHLAGRNVKPEWRADPDRIVVVSAYVHHLITIGWIVQEGDHAAKVRWHWSESVKAEHRTFRIKSRRRSQQVSRGRAEGQA